MRVADVAGDFDRAQIVSRGMTDDGQEMAEGSGDNVAGSSDEKKDGEVAAPAAAAGHLDFKI